ncbi:polysaccharide biosynthesis C-terminal domain-containing protein [Candidatus Woesearchaeota archaeon]|nr:polysaccharide biosynthesis C-terminal domain-containing protein [Candidatus Woesearchaeota archaeon]
MSAKYHRITKQLGFSYFFMILTFLIGPFLIFLLTRTLSVKEFGIYSLLASTVAIFTVILDLGFHKYIVTKLSGLNYLKGIKHFFSLLTLELGFLVVLFVVLFLSPLYGWLLEFLKLSSYETEFQLCLTIIFLGVIFRFFVSYLKARKKIELQSFYSFFHTSFWVLILISFYLIKNQMSLLTVVSIWLVGVVITVLLLTFFSLRKEIIIFLFKIKKIDTSIMKKGLVFSLPLIPVFVASYIIEFADRYMLNSYMDAEKVGFYALSYSLVWVIISFSAVIHNVLYVHAANAWNQKKNHHTLFNAMFKYDLMFVLPAIVGLFVMREQVITLISGPNYLIGASTIGILILSPLFVSLATLFQNNLLLRSKTKTMAIIYIFGAVLNILLNMFLIPKYGIDGAAISTTISYFLMLFMSYVVSRKQILWNYGFLKIFRIIFASAFMGVIVYSINPQIYLTKIITIVVGVVVYVVLLFLFRVFSKKEYSIMNHFLPKFLKLK